MRPSRVLLLTSSILALLAPGFATATEGDGAPESNGAERSLQHVDNVSVVPRTALPPDDVAGIPTPDHGGTDPLATPDHEGTDEGATPGVDASLVTIVVCNAGDVTGCNAPGSVFLCVDAEVVTPDGPSTVPIACVARRLAKGVESLVPRGEFPLVVVPSQRVPGTPPVSVPDVPGTPAVPIPDVPGVPAGGLGESPEVTVTIDAYYRYEPDRVTVAGGVLGQPVRTPFDPSEPEWLVAQPGAAPLVVRVIVYENGVERAAHELPIPWLGQVLGGAGA